MAQKSREQRLVTEQQAADLLRERRKARGLSQQDLADKLSVTQARLSALEGGRAHITLQRLIAVAQLLDLEVVLRERPAKPRATEW